MFTPAHQLQQVPSQTLWCLVRSFLLFHLCSFSIPSLPAPPFPSSPHSPFRILCLPFPFLSFPFCLFFSFCSKFITSLTLAADQTAPPPLMIGSAGPSIWKKYTENVIFTVKLQTRICRISWLEWKFDYFSFFHSAVGFLRPNIQTMKGKGLVAKAARDTMIEKEQRRSDTGLYKLMALANSSRCCFVCSCPFVGQSAQNKANWEHLCMKNNKNSMCDVRMTLLLVPFLEEELRSKRLNRKVILSTIFPFFSKHEVMNLPLLPVLFLPFYNKALVEI